MLIVGSRGPKVQQVQMLLRAFDAHLAADGVFGLHTERAVRLAQRRLGLYPPDGIVGPMTQNALEARGALAAPKQSAVHHASATYSKAGEPMKVSGTAAHERGGKGDPGPLRPTVDPARERARSANMGAEVAAPVAGMRMSLAGRQFIIRHEAQAGVSNHLHHPSMGSGVTIGPGYDMKDRSAAQVAGHLRLINVPPAQAAAAAEGASLTKQRARDFVNAHKTLLDLTDAQQAALLTYVVGHYEAMVHKAIVIDLHQYEFDALVSYAYNPGGGWIATTRCVNLHQPHEDMLELSKHVFSQGEKIRSLVVRRAAESRMFLYGEYI